MDRSRTCDGKSPGFLFRRPNQAVETPKGLPRFAVKICRHGVVHVAQPMRQMDEILHLRPRTARDLQKMQILLLGLASRTFRDIGGHRTSCAAQLARPAVEFSPRECPGELVDGNRRVAGELPRVDLPVVSHGCSPEVRPSSCAPVVSSSCRLVYCSRFTVIQPPS